MSQYGHAERRGWIDNQQDYPQAVREQTKLVKITEDVRSYAAEPSLTNEAAIESGMQEKRKEFLEQGTEVYTGRA